MIPHMESLLNEYLTTDIDTKTFIDGQDVLVTDKKAVSAIRSMRLLEELLYYNRDDNFDAVSGMFLIAVWLRQQKLKPIQYESTRQYDKEASEFKRMFSTPAISKKHPAFSY